MIFLHRATFATAVQPELNVWSTAFVLTMLALAIWFIVISIDVATDFHRFQKLEARSTLRTEQKRRTERVAPERDQPSTTSKDQAVV